MDQNTKLAVMMLGLVGVVLLVALLVSSSHHSVCPPDMKWTKNLKGVFGYTMANATPPLLVKCKGPDGKVDQDKVNTAAMCMVDTVSASYTPAETFADGGKSPLDDETYLGQLINTCAAKAQCAGN